MKYFSIGIGYGGEAVTQAALLEIALREMNERSEKDLEDAKQRIAAAGYDPDHFIPSPKRPRKPKPPGTPAQDALAEEHALAVRELEQVSAQIAQDASHRWSTGARYFAPVLYQVIDRSVASFDSDLEAVTDVGWHLESWQPIGPAPAPYGAQVLLIQAVFSRPVPGRPTESKR